MAYLFLFQEMHFNGSDKNDNKMDHCEMFAEDVALFDYHFYQSCCNWRRELCSQLFYIYFYAFYSILPESTYLLGFYCTASRVHKIMLLALILILNFSSLLSKENAVGMVFQSQTEYKIRNAF